MTSTTPRAGPLSCQLACHPGTPALCVDGIDVAVAGEAGGRLTLRYTLAGDLAGLLIPAFQAPRRADGLWRHTCFEAFVMAGDGPGYREFNFSPSGAWAVLAFRGYRDGGPVAAGPGPAITVQRDGDCLQLTAQLGPGLLPPGRALRLGLAAVVEDAGGGLSCWALRHAPGRPDFHHPEAFALQPVLP